MFQRTRVAFAALACASLSAMLGTARAAGAGTSYEIYSSLSDLQYTLTDLRPDDGIDASVSFSSSGQSAYVGGLATAGTNSGNQKQSQLSPANLQSPDAPFNATASVTFPQQPPSDNAGASAHVSGNLLAANVHLSQAKQNFYGESTLFALNTNLAEDSSLIPELIQDTFVLAPHSQLTLTGMAKYGVVRLGEGNCDNCRVYVSADTQLLSADLYWRLRSNDIPDEQLPPIYSLYDVFSIGNYINDALFVDSQTRLLSLTFTNDSDEAKGFGFIARTVVQAQSFAVVPEPGTWGLALGGLMVVGAAARRRTR